MTNPREVLGIPLNAGAEEIRAAYLSKVKEFPPERFPDEFEAIRDAFESLSDPRKRTLAMLKADDPRGSTLSILDGEVKHRIFIGPQAWLDVLKTQEKRTGVPGK